MGGIFFALVFAGWVPAALLIVGVALAIVATVLYARTGAARPCAAPRKRSPSLHNLQPSVEPLARATYNRSQAANGGGASRSRSEMEDTFPDLGSLSDEELKELIDKLTDEENEISYKRRVLHGKIDILRAELVNRLRQKRESGRLADLRRRRATS